MASEAQIRGYVLEELLAFLIGNSGYSLLPEASYDPQELVDQPNGLAVRGRGATHQADVLGQLSWVPAFTYPLRLFVEAKYYARGRVVGLSIVRAVIGVLDDVNQNFHAIPGSSPVLLRRRYAYRCALFSAPGFDRHAIELAYAHGISLVDLSTPSFAPLRDSVEAIARGVVRSEERGNALPLPELRRGLRRILEPEIATEAFPNQGDLTYETVELLHRIRAKTTLNDLLLGVPDAPFVLVLQPDDIESFLRVARSSPRHRVRVRYRFETEGTEWEVSPIDVGVGTYRLVFALPAALDEWILSVAMKKSPRVANRKSPRVAIEKSSAPGV